MGVGPLLSGGTIDGAGLGDIEDRSENIEESSLIVTLVYPMETCTVVF